MAESTATKQRQHDAAAESQDDTPTYRLYELGYHLMPTIPADELSAEVSRLKELIREYGGECTAEAFPTRIELAYPVEQRRSHGGQKQLFDTAHFGWLVCSLAPDAAYQLHQRLEADTHILRHLLVRTTEGEVERSKARAAEKQAPAENASDENSNADIDHAVDELTQNA